MRSEVTSLKVPEARALSLSLSLSLCAAARGVDVSEMGCFVGKRNTFFVSQLPFE